MAFAHLFASACSPASSKAGPRAAAGSVSDLSAKGVPALRNAMRVVTLAHAEDFEGWRSSARALAIADVPPGDINWQIGSAPADLFAERNGDPLPAPTGV